MKKLWSAFTDDMDHCYFTGTSPVERHHIFGANNKKNSEKYGYILPLAPHLHPNGVQAGRDAKSIDTNLKQMAQNHFEEHHGTREEFMQIFGRNYL